MAEKQERSTIIRVKVIPRSSRNGIVGHEAGVWKLRVTSPPVEGQANQAVREFLAGCLGIAKGRVEIVSGDRSNHKSIRVEGMAADEVRHVLGRKGLKRERA